MECPEEYLEEAIERIQHHMRYPFKDGVEFEPALLSEADFGDSYQDAKQTVKERKIYYAVICY